MSNVDLSQIEARLRAEFVEVAQLGREAKAQGRDADMHWFLAYAMAIAALLCDDFRLTILALEILENE